MSWVTQIADAQHVHELAKALGISSISARLLVHRGLGSLDCAHDYLFSDLSSLPQPSLLTDLEKAAQLLRRTISRKEKILIVGDYDADGVTATALLVSVLKELGGRVSCHIPHRIHDGYGLKPKVIQEAAEKGIKLLISVDCGTTSFEELRMAKKLGLATIVVDHHELLPEGAPPASAFLNPLQPGDCYPTKGLASVGVAFTLARGLVRDPWEHLDLVALGTVADVAPLTGENRILVKRGLACLRGTSKPGLRALLARTRLENGPLTTEDVSFMLAPRLNAMGRLGEASVSLKLLVTDDQEEAQQLVSTMEEHNRQRSTLQQEAMRWALSKVEREVNFAKERVIVLEDERWHPGVVGIVASRLASRFHRPVIVIALEGEVGRGSARSIPSFPLTEALEEVKEHLVTFGGHPAAAGLTIERPRLASFRQAINQVAAQRMDPKALSSRLEVDGELPFSHLTQELMREMELLSPFGTGNPWPIFTSEDLREGKRVKVAYTPSTRHGKNGSRITVKVRDLVWL